MQVDHVAGVHDAIAHLVGLGRLHIGLVASAQLPGAPRHLAFRSRLDELGLHRDAHSEVEAPETFHGGEEAVGRLLAAYPDLDAVLVYNDVMAASVLKGLSRRGIAVPSQVAVIGADGLGIGEVVTPELTTLDIDKGAFARHAMEAVDAIMTSGVEAARAAGRSVPLVLKVRESA